MIIRQIKENELKQMEGFLYDALFVNEGDTIKIDTRTGEYLSRV